MGKAIQALIQTETWEFFYLHFGKEPVGHK